MLKQENIAISGSSLWMQKWTDYKQLMKLNLSLLVVFSSVVGYLIVPDIGFDLLKVSYLFIGGLLVAGAANATNELLEKKWDALMKRTMDRPLPQRRMPVSEAAIFIVLTLTGGLALLYIQFNIWTAVISLLSYLIYSFVYTPMKRKSAFSVLVGALPGSLPCLIGWVAGTGSIYGMAPWALFAIQFFWQFPHFWAIAWLGHEDYQKAGMKMLPQKDKESRFTAVQAVFYTSMLIPLGILPYVCGLGSEAGAAVLVIAALVFVRFAFGFFKNNDDKSARQLMFASFIYLPVILLTLLIDKFI